VRGAGLARRVLLYNRKSRFFVENARPWNRARVKWEFLQRESYIASPFYGPILGALREDRLEVGPSVTLMPDCWLNVPPGGRLRIGQGTYLNRGVFVAAYSRVDIGEFCMFSNGCFITDADHRFDDPVLAVPEQGYRVKGPTIIGDNVWCGVNVAIMGGVSIGQRCVIGANSVVTRDLEPFSVAAGSPARVIRRMDPGPGQPDSGQGFPGGSAGTGMPEDWAS
jgi:acetyltransferase-like isoleucine patch superfamily enzyme